MNYFLPKTILVIGCYQLDCYNWLSADNSDKTDITIQLCNQTPHLTSFKYKFYVDLKQYDACFCFKFLNAELANSQSYLIIVPDKNVPRYFQNKQTLQSLSFYLFGNNMLQLLNIDSLSITNCVKGLFT